MGDDCDQSCEAGQGEQKDTRLILGVITVHRCSSFGLA